MAIFTLANLVGYIRRAAGEDGVLELSDHNAETTFAELGYDSLAMMELTSLVERELGVSLPEEKTDKESTPQGFVDLVNESLPTSGQPVSLQNRTAEPI